MSLTLSQGNAAPPEWWQVRGIFDGAQPTNDFAGVNVGQLKNVAKKAMQELDDKLAYAGGAGTSIAAAVASFSATGNGRDDFAAVNIGQLKAVAKPFYDRLNALNYNLNIPWADAASDRNDYAASNIGQLKNVFSFAIPISIIDRLAARRFPSVFQAWGPVENVPVSEDANSRAARHDIYWDGNWDDKVINLMWDQYHIGLASDFTAASKTAFQVRKAELRIKNPNLLLLLELRYLNGPLDEGGGWTWLPPTHQWWKKDAGGVPLIDPADPAFRLLDYGSAGLRAQIAQQAAAAVAAGLDGIMLDWWYDDSNIERQQLVEAIRGAIGPEKLIIVNSNRNKVPNTKQHINGLFMESEFLNTASLWADTGDTLRWAEINLRTPKVNCLETWHTGPDTSTASRNTSDALRRMRAVTTMSLTQSNGFSLFSDANGLPANHTHDWYAFWNRIPASLGKATSSGEWNGSVWIRTFENGWAVHNSQGSGDQTINLPEAATSRRTGNRSSTHVIPDFDGDILIKNP